MVQVDLLFLLHHLVQQDQQVQLDLLDHEDQAQHHLLHQQDLRDPLDLLVLVVQQVLLDLLYYYLQDQQDLLDPLDLRVLLFLPHLLHQLHLQDLQDLLDPQDP